MIYQTPALINMWTKIGTQTQTHSLQSVHSFQHTTKNSIETEIAKAAAIKGITQMQGWPVHALKAKAASAWKPMTQMTSSWKEPHVSARKHSTINTVGQLSLKRMGSGSEEA